MLNLIQDEHHAQSRSTCLGAVYKGRPANGEGGGFEISDIPGRGEGGGL